MPTPPNPIALRPRFARTLLVAVIFAVLAGFSFAQHNPDGDRIQSANANATITYTRMPQVRERLEANTGNEVEYSYVIVCVGADCMAVDPFRFNR